MSDVTAIVLVIGTVFSALIIVLYWVVAKWWSNAVGRFIMGQSCALMVLFGYYSVRHFLKLVPPATPSTYWSTLGTYALVVLWQGFAVRFLIREVIRQAPDRAVRREKRRAKRQALRAAKHEARDAEKQSSE